MVPRNGRHRIGIGPEQAHQQRGLDQLRPSTNEGLTQSSRRLGVRVRSYINPLPRLRQPAPSIRLDSYEKSSYKGTSTLKTR